MMPIVRRAIATAANPAPSTGDAEKKALEILSREVVRLQQIWAKMHAELTSPARG